MKDFTVYSKYETFVKQLTDIDDTVIYNTISTSKYISKFIEHFGIELSKPGFSTNDVMLEIVNRINVNNSHQDVRTLIYIPCVDKYQKQYNVFVMHLIDACQLITSTNNITCMYQAYKETVNPMCISNANIKDILQEQKNIVIENLLN